MNDNAGEGTMDEADKEILNQANFNLDQKFTKEDVTPTVKRNSVFDVLNKTYTGPFSNTKYRVDFKNMEV
jgi:hypothetical protein